MHRTFRSSTLLLLFISFASSQPVFSQSEATAEYSVTFTGNWTLASTPGGVVSGAYFTRIAGGKHNSSVSFWSPGATATSGLEALAEVGSTTGFINEINASTHTDASFTSSGTGSGTGTSTFTLNMKRTHPLVTLASMIGPSPDWFVGLHDYSLLDSDNDWVFSVTVNLYPYDAGTEDGTEFTLSNPATSPQGVITSLRGVGKFSNEPMATISFTRQDSPPSQSAPTITTVERPTGVSQATNANSVTWLVTFSEAVQNVSTDDFVVSGTTASVTSVSLTTGSTTKYRVVVSGGNLANLDATISLGLASQQNITNSSGVALSTTPPSSSETYTLDNTAPRVVSVAPTSVNESPFTATITFNESIDSSSFTEVGDVSSDEATVSAPNGSGLSYQVSVTPDDPLRPSTITLTIVAGAAADLAGNTSTEHEATIEYTPDVASIPPVVDRVSALIPDGLYHAGEIIVVGVDFSQPVTVIGIPMLMLQFDQSIGTARYARGSGTNTLIFDYTLMSGDSAENLGYTDAAALSPGTGSITGATGLSAVLTLPVPGSTGSLRQSSDIETSGREDMMPTFGTSAINNQVLMMNQRVDSIQLPAASGGDEPLQYALEPMLPPGLQLDAEGRSISGTPTEVFEMTTYTWSATDRDGDRVSLTFTIMILQRLPLQFPSSTSIPDQVFLQNDEIATVDLPVARGGDGALAYSLSPDLPSGLSLDLAARQISGIPTEVLGPTTFTWRVVDAEGASAELTFSMTVLEDLQPTFATGGANTNQVFIQGSAITPFTLPSATSGNGQLTHDLVPDLPEGLVLDMTSFEISGSATSPQMRTKFEWSATDSDGDAATFSFYITVLEDLMPSFTGDAVITEREFISDSEIEPFSLPAAMGGNGSLNYSLSPDLPSGLELNSTLFEISGTPTTAQARTQFTWTVTDVDGDSISLKFYLTVIQDTQPVFSDQVEDKVFVMGMSIESFTLPDASGGNGELTYEFSPQLQNGLRLDVDSAVISGTPSAEAPTSTYSWTVTDVDGDTATLTFSITVNPAQPELVGSIANVQLVVGGSAQTVDASSAVEGRVDSWRVEVSNADVANVSSSAAGVLTLSPRIEGQTTVTVHASNVTGAVELEFSVNVATAGIENDQIDQALSLKAGAILSSAMNVFKHRTHSHKVANDTSSASTLPYARKMELDESLWYERRDPNLMNYGYPSLGDQSTVNAPASVGLMNDFVPLNFAHTSTRWSMWGAIDFQNFSTDTTENEIDGTLSSLYFGTDLAVNDNVAAGIAYARHVGSSAYEFSSGDASGDAEIDTTLNGLYPYLQAGDGNRFSMFLVGGIGYGDSQIDRNHAPGSDQDSDTDLTLFAGGFDYVIMRRSNLDFAIVGDAGVATLTTQADSGVLANRDSSSSKSSIGGSVSFNPQIEGGSMVTSVDIRLANGADGDESGSGFELGGNLNYFGERIDFMLDGRTTSRSADTDIQRSSISARLRYRAKSDGTGLTFALSPKWQDSALLTTSERFEPSLHAQGLLPYAVNAHRSVEGEIAYGFLSNHETSLFKPRLAWQRIDTRGNILKLGTRWQFLRTSTPGSSWGIDLVRNTSNDGRDAYGFTARVEMRL